MVDDQFFTEYDSHITNCILRYTRPPIEDYKQDIYLILCEHKFHNQNLKAYIATIIRNYFYQKFRRKKIEFDYKVISVTNTSDLHLFYKDVTHLIDSLPAGECIKLYSLGYKYREIAEKLDINISSVKSNIYRVRMKLNAKSKQENR